MVDLCRLIWCVIAALFRSPTALQAEILILRHQLNVLRRRSPRCVALSSVDRLVFVGLCRLAPEVLDALTILQPETVIRWHRAGFRSHWRWKSRSRGGRPKTPVDNRQLIRQMSVANPLWGAPRIHGELLKLGINVGQTTVAKYMAKRRLPPSQGWKTFLRNHADGIASVDMFVVPTISFRLLYGLLVPRHSRRNFPWLGEADRIDPARLPRSRRDLWRAASPPFAQLLPRILRRESYASIAEEGRADSARRPEGRTRARFANLGWASLSIRSSLNIRQGRPGQRSKKLSSARLPTTVTSPGLGIVAFAFRGRYAVAGVGRHPDICQPRTSGRSFCALQDWLRIVCYPRRDAKCQNCTLVHNPQRKRVAGALTRPCFARYGGCIQVGSLSEIKAPVAVRTILKPAIWMPA
jgi:hypothetical protein